MTLWRNFRNRLRKSPWLAFSLFSFLGIALALPIVTFALLPHEDAAGRFFLVLDKGMPLSEVIARMSKEQIDARIEDEFIQFDPNSREWIIGIQVADSDWMPRSRIQLDLLDGKVERKHLFRPSALAICKHWASKILP